MKTKTKRPVKKLSLAALRKLSLAHGAHNDRSNGLCVMEVVSWVAGEPHSDHPACVSPIIAQFCRLWNDAMNDDDRNEFLKPLVPKIIGTATNAADEQTRSLLAIDWLIREFVPAWLDLVPSLKAHAAALSSAKPIQSWDDVVAITEALRLARKDSAAAGAAAWAAAGDAARAAAWAAAGDAARAAAGAAAGDAAWVAAWVAAWAAAGVAAWDAAGVAAWDAAGAAAMAAAMDAAGDAAGDALNQTTQKLQRSAANLVLRMCAVGKKRPKRKAA